MKRFLLLFIALFFLSGAFAQTETSLNCVLNAQKTVNLPMILKGPESSSCQPVPLMMEVTYKPEDDLINVVIRPKYIKPLLRKEQYTHLWFPMTLGETLFQNLTFEDHFRRNFRSKVALENTIYEQINVNQSTDMFKPSLQCLNGMLINQQDKDLMLSLKEGKVIVLKIRVLNSSTPVVLKINNVVPLRAWVDFPQFFNKSFLQYISNNFSITFRFPEGDCFGEFDRISQYKRWNSELKSDYEKLLNFLIANKSTQSDNKDNIRKRLQTLSKYETARKGIRKTDCEELLQEYSTFQTYYNKVGEGVVTADSLQRMIDDLDELIDGMSIARNTGNGKSCRAMKEKAERYNNIHLDESIYGDFPELRSLMQRFQERRRMVNSIKCPGGGDNSGSSGGSGGGRCKMDTEKIKSATMKINNLLNEYRIKKVKNDKAFNSIVKETDSYLKEFPESCKKDSRYKTVIQQYQGAKKTYLDAVK